jgi:hypothetical protein
MPGDPCSTSRMARSSGANFASRSSTGRVPESGEKKERKEIKPGPGSYVHKEFVGDTGTGTSFQRSPERFQPRSRTETPDPGSYSAVEPNATSKFAKQGGYGFGGLSTRRMDREALTNGVDKDAEGGVDENGLDASNANGMRSPRGSTAGTEKRDQPGPGSYEVIYAGPNVLSAAPRWGFGSLEARPSLMGQSRQATIAPTPGPGTYVYGTRIGESGPKFSIRKRGEENRESTPGPGA